jgi:lipopolysaccharide cholinephosphotransferase
MEKINTDKGIYEYELKNLETGNHIINREISKENLLELKKVFDKNKIKFILSYGTLLGTIRENNFIEYDEDVDVAILDEDRLKLINTLFELRNIGLEVVRYKKDLMSVMKNGEYIDIYIFRKGYFGYRNTNKQVIKEKYLKDTIKYELFGVLFDIPNDYKNYLIDLYGQDWLIPKNNCHAYSPNRYVRLKRFINKRLFLK